MEMIRVSSSATRAFGYDQLMQRLQISFQQEHSYDFCGIPDHVYEELMTASSKDTYYNDSTRDRYQCR